MKDQIGLIFGRVNEDGNIYIGYVSEGEPVCRLDADVYPVGSDFSVRYEHPEGIVLTRVDAEKLGIDIEDELTARAKMLMGNDLNWYVVTTDCGNYELKHASMLSAILECGEPMESYDYTAIEQCWNGEDLSTEDDWL